MNFKKYEQEMSNFLNENYQNLKRIKVANSEFALKELLQTEQADINNYARSLVSKIIKDVRKNFVTAIDIEKGYELGEKYKALINVPEFNQIKVNFIREVPMNKQVNSNVTQQIVKQSTAQNFKTNSPMNQYRARNLAIGAGATTAVIGLPAAILLRSASFGTSLLGIGLSVVVVAGIVYTLVSYVDDSGKQQTSYVAPTPTKKEKPATATISTKKTIDQASMSHLLDLRKAEAQKVLLKTIEEAKQKYEQLQAQIQTV